MEIVESKSEASATPTGIYVLNDEADHWLGPYSLKEMTAFWKDGMIRRDTVCSLENEDDCFYWDTFLDVSVLYWHYQKSLFQGVS